MIRFLRSAIACGLVAVVGCGKTHYSVEGKVTFKGGRDGKALTGAMVLFEPTEPGTLSSSRGYVRDDGRYTMGTMSDTDGVPPGRYKVLVLPPPITNPEKPPPDWPPLKEKWGRMDQSPFSIEVERKANVLDLEVD